MESSCIMNSQSGFFVIMKLIIYILIVIQFSHHSIAISNNKISKCSQYSDTYGEWLNINNDHGRHTTNISSFSKYFIGDIPRENTIISFNKIWLPSNCSYHRFTNKTIHYCVEKQIELNSKANGKSNILSFAIFGDSGIRGIVCGIIRLLSGSELYGPNDNVICGGKKYGDPVSFKAQQHRYNDIYFYNGKLLITFTYVKDFLRNLEGSITNLIKENYYAIILNTGAWDFYKVPRYYSSQQNVTEHCVTNESIDVSKGRSASWINDTMWRLSKLAESKKIRLIYRNSHYNKRFGTLCADEAFESMIKGSHWEVWDNRRISKNVWMEQTMDGYHFDRNKAHSIEDHMQAINISLSKKKPVLGELEMQLSQSLLQSLFYDCIQIM